MRNSNSINPLAILCTCVSVFIGGCGAQVGSSNRPGPVDPDAPTEFTVTDSGLKYRILRKSGGRKPAATDRVTVHYSGWLDDTSEFDSSYGRGNAASLPLDQVVEGWREGMQLVGEGGMIELEIPSELGYGAAGRPPKIPPNATLHFKVELFEIE